MAGTYTRQAVYDLVWSTPISQLAKRFNLSDRGFAKVCERHQIPVPGRGYWARIEAGQVVTRPNLPTVTNSALDHLSLWRVDPHTQFLFEATTAAKRAMEQEALEAAAAPAKKLLSESQSALDSLAKRLRISTPDIKNGRVKVGWIEIDPKSISRVITFLTELSRQLQSFGIVFVTEGDKTEFLQDGSSVHFSVRGPQKRVPSTVRSWQRYHYVFTGKLTLEVYGWAKEGRKNWVFEPDDDILDEVDQISECFRLNLLVRRTQDEKDRRGKERLQHLANRRELAKKREEREAERKAFVEEIANARQEIEELRTLIALLPNSPKPLPEYSRMVDWANGQLAQLEQRTQVGVLAAMLVEKKLFPEPDDLFDPEGEPPAGSGVWD